MSDESLSVHLRALARAATVLLVLFGAALAGAFGIVLFIFAGRKDWGLVYLLSMILMLSFDSEEYVRGMRKTIGRK